MTMKSSIQNRIIYFLLHLLLWHTVFSFKTSSLINRYYLNNNYISNVKLFDIKEIFTNNEFNSIIETKCLKVIDFQKSHCKPCIKVAPLYKELAEKYCNQIEFYKVDADSSKEALGIMKLLGIRSVPTFYVYNNGNIVDTIQGANFDEVEDALKAELRKIDNIQ